MKHLALSVLIALTFSGCIFDTKYILVPQTVEYPTFPTEAFSLKGKQSTEIWQEQDSEGEYLCTKKDDGLKILKDAKLTKVDYNTLYTKLIEFNKKIEALNEKQKNQKPKEVNDYDMSKLD